LSEPLRKTADPIEEPPISCDRLEAQNSSKMHLRIVRHINNNRRRIIWLAVLAIATLATITRITAPTKVNVITVQGVKTTETLGATGVVRGERTVELGLDTVGVVRNTYVKEGNFVRAGTVILSVDQSELNAAVDSAQAGVDSAMAELARVRRSALPSEIEQVRAEIAQADHVGRARVSEAKARLRDLQAGSRHQEIAQVQAGLISKKASLNKAETDLKRMQRLVSAGAVAQQQLDAAKTQVEMERAAVTAEQQRLNLLKAGARPEQLSEARAAVAEAQASYWTGVKAARERLNTLLAQPRHEDVRSAQAKVAQARAEMRRTIAAGNKSEVRAPFDGIVADLIVEKGQSVSPGQNLVEFQEISKPVIEVETDESNLSILNRGMKAIVSTDAYPGRTFQAILYDLGSMANSDRGTVEIKLRPTEHINWLKPELTVDVNIITGTKANRIILPPDTITRINRYSTVLVAKDGIATPVRVTTGAAGPNGVVVSGDLKDGDLIVRQASRISPMKRIRPMKED
jgi:HlyD family secretion protein